MAIRFFKKGEPKNSPVLANGSRCDFTSLDHRIGYFAIDNDYVSGELERLMGEGRYGMSEISAEEYTRDYIEKKKALNGRVSKPLWREEIAPRQASSDTIIAKNPNPAVAVAVANAVLVPESLPAPVAPEGKPAITVTDANPVPSSAPTTEFKPTLAKRAKIKTKKPE